MKQISEKVKGWLRDPVFWARFAAYALPLGFLLYVLYWNFLPFGYSKTFVIEVGSESDTNASQEFYLEPSRDLSERKIAEDGTAYRELNGVAYAIFKPKAVLKDAEITVEVEGEGVSIISPVIDFDPDSVEWDYNWDFTKGTSSDLIGNAFVFDSCMYFDGKSKLELPNSADKFEDGPFSVYVEWTPEDKQKDFQQIVGHYNWEIRQDTDKVVFQIGRVNSRLGEFYSIEFPVDKDFFHKTHSLIATYSPSVDGDKRGYIELYVDRIFIERLQIEADTIWKDYGNKNITLGKSFHGSSEFLVGCIKNVGITNSPIISYSSRIKIENSLSQYNHFQFYSTASSSISSVEIRVEK